MRRALPLLLLAFGCSDPLQVGNDLLWTADQEPGTLEQWTRDGSGDALEPRTEEKEGAPSKPSSVEVSTEAAHAGNHSVKLVNPGGWEHDFEGPELFHTAGELGDAYYSAWFMLPEQYEFAPYLTIMRLRSRDDDGLVNGEELQLRSLSTGGYVLSVFNNDANYLLEPVADPAPYVEVGRWFQLEARYVPVPQTAGRLRVWLDGTLFYDLPERPGSPGEQLLSVCNVAKSTTPTPAVLFVDDAAVSLSRTSPSGKLSED